jgi:hypothetical protein
MLVWGPWRTALPIYCYSTPARAFNEIHTFIRGINKLARIAKSAVVQAGNANRNGDIDRVLVVVSHGRFF